jgi:uncharacterized protein (DUF2267 family)
MAGSSLMEDLSEAIRQVDPSVRPEEAARAVLCVLAQRLSGGEARHLVDQLPEELRSSLRVCVSHPTAPVPGWHLNTFRDLVTDHLGIPGTKAEPIIRAVFSVLHRHLDPSEEHRLRTQLPSDLRTVWEGKP